MSTLQQQARALGDPTRHAVFARIAAADHPLVVSEIVADFDLHPNAIRQHLAQLVEAELVVESRAAPSGPGRPRSLFAVHPTALNRWGERGPYEELSRLLAEILETGDAPREVGRRAAERFRLATPSGDPIADITDAMARQGFDPATSTKASAGKASAGKAASDDPATGTELVLRTCPFATAASAGPNTVCELHLGIAEGLAEGTAATVVEMVANDPEAAGCVLKIELDSPEEQDDDAGHDPDAERAKLTLRSGRHRRRT